MRHYFATLSMVLLASSLHAQETYSAKALFFGEDDSIVTVSTNQKEKSTTTANSTASENKQAPLQIAQKKPVKAQTIGVSYFIRLKNSDGSTQDVLTSRKFKSGERFQLGVKVNSPTYIYVLNEGPNGKVSLIYPQPGTDNFVNAMGTVFLPSKGSFQFDNEPGSEQLLVYVSKTAVPQGLPDRIKTLPVDVMAMGTTPVVAPLNCLQPSATNQTVMASGSTQIASADGYTSKGIAYADDAACNSANQKGESYAAKGIAFSDDTDSSGLQPVSYAVKKSEAQDANLLLKIKLQHQ